MSNAESYLEGGTRYKQPDLYVFQPNSSCSYPKFQPILEKSCAYDFEKLSNSSCCEDVKYNRLYDIQGKKRDRSSPCGKLNFNVLACSIQAVQTYIYCTGARPSSTVTTCVNETAQRINFVPIGYQVASTSYKCQSPQKLIRRLAVYNALSLLWALLNNPQLVRNIIARFKKSNRPSENTFELNMVTFWLTLARGFGETLITAHYLERVGQRVSFFREVLIWAVRPRAASLVGLLGFFHPGWVGAGIQDMVADVILSCFGGYFAFQGAIAGSHSSNPLRVYDGKMYVSGGIISSLALWIIGLFTTIGSTILTTPCCWPACRQYFRIWVDIFKFLFGIPCKQFIVICANLFRRITGGGRQSLSTIEFRGSVMFAYTILWLLSVVVFIGNWMYWKGFLLLSDELYCPGSLASIDMVFVVAPLLINVSRLVMSL